MKKKIFASLICLFFLCNLSSCSIFNSSSGARKVLTKFIEARFNKSLTRNEMMFYITGDMAKEVEEMEDESFSFFSKLEGFKKNSLKVLTENCLEAKCVIVYQLKYDEFENQKKQFSTEVKKVAEVVQNKFGEWKVSKVNNIKTYLKSHQPIMIK